MSIYILLQIEEGGVGNISCSAFVLCAYLT